MVLSRSKFYRLLGKQLATVRRDRKVTQDRLAAAVGLSRTSIANVEAGRQALAVHTLVAFASVLGKDPAELIPLIEEMPPTAGAEQKLSKLSPEERMWAKKFLPHHSGKSR